MILEALIGTIVFLVVYRLVFRVLLFFWLTYFGYLSGYVLSELTRRGLAALPPTDYVALNFIQIGILAISSVLLRAYFISYMSATKKDKPAPVHRCIVAIILSELLFYSIPLAMNTLVQLREPAGQPQIPQHYQEFDHTPPWLRKPSNPSP